MQVYILASKEQLFSEGFTSTYLGSLFLSRALECAFWVVALVFKGYGQWWGTVVYYVILTEFVHTAILSDCMYQTWKLQRHDLPRGFQAFCTSVFSAIMSLVCVPLTGFSASLQLTLTRSPMLGKRFAADTERAPLG